jgi:hypothetical protein
MEDNMITFKPHNDLLKLNYHDPAYPVWRNFRRQSWI